MNKVLSRTAVFFALAGSSLFANTQEIQDLEITNNKQEIQNLEITKSIENSFGYINGGMESLFSAPVFGLGYRVQKDHHGLDVSLSIALRSINSRGCYRNRTCSAKKSTRKKASILYNYFFNPDLNSQYYAGLGVGLNDIDKEKSRFILGFSPEIVLGEQYKNKKGAQRFVQLQISLPSVYNGSEKIESYHEYKQKLKANSREFPFFTLTYGIGF